MHIQGLKPKIINNQQIMFFYTVYFFRVRTICFGYFKTAK